MIGLEIAKPGFNIETALEKDKIFSSKHKTFNVGLKGSLKIPASAANITLTVEHNLKYAPTFFCYFIATDSITKKEYLMPAPVDLPFPFNTTANPFPYVDEKQLKVYVPGGETYGTTFYYILGKNKLDTKG